MRLIKYVGLTTTFIFTLTSCVSTYSVNAQSFKEVPTAPVKFASQNLTISEIYTDNKRNEEIVNNSTLPNSTSNNLEEEKSAIIINEAHSWIGTPYRYGGSSKRGIDCSAFVQAAYSSVQVNLPRISSVQATVGKTVRLHEVKKGDLLFFATRGRGISHVAIVERVEESGEIFFIHASSSEGVTINSLFDSYWNSRYLKAQRIIEDNTASTPIASLN